MTEAEKECRLEIYDQLKSAIIYCKFYRTNKFIVENNFRPNDSIHLQDLVDDRDAALEAIGMAVGLCLSIILTYGTEEDNYHKKVRHIANRISQTREVVMKVFNR